MDHKLLLISTLLFSGCIHAPNNIAAQNSAINNVNFPINLTVTESSDDSLIITYSTTIEEKSLTIPTIRLTGDEQSYGNLQYFDLRTRTQYTNYLAEQDKLNYLLGDFTNVKFLNPEPVLQLEITRDDSNQIFINEFKFDKDKQSFIHDQSYQLVYLNSCGHELGTIKKISYQGNTDELEFIDFKQLHQNLFSTGFYEGDKVIPDILLADYNKLRSNDETVDRKEIVESLIHTDDSREGYRCPISEYISTLYHFEDNVDISNDLANFFAQEGYHKEAIELLSSIISSHPNRVDAYLNIANSYQAIGDNYKANKYYKQYAKKKTELYKLNIIPIKTL